MIDAHLHIWDTSAVQISWLADAGLLPRAPLPTPHDERRYILVEADADDPHQEAVWLARVAARDARIHGVIASVALELAGAGEALANIMTLPKIVGVRRLLQDRDLFESSGLLQGLKLLVAHDLPFDACVRASELPALTRLLAQVPELTVVLDHMGKPDVGDASAMREWRHNLAALAALPNVNCKISGLPAECRDTEELNSVAEEVIDTAVRLFGANRCLLGSDHPISQDTRDWCMRVLALLPSDARQAVAHDNPLRIYSRRTLS